MLNRLLAADLRERLAFYPGVVLLGPRQVGKTTLAKAIATQPEGLEVDAHVVPRTEQRSEVGSDAYWGVVVYNPHCSVKIVLSKFTQYEYTKYTKYTSLETCQIFC